MVWSRGVSGWREMVSPPGQLPVRPGRELDEIALMRSLYRGRRIVAALLASVLAFSMAEGALADVGPSGPPDALAASAPSGDLSSPDGDCPPGCACPCVCACPGTGAIPPTASVSEVGVDSPAELAAPNQMTTIHSPEPLLHPPLR